MGCPVIAIVSMSSMLPPEYGMQVVPGAASASSLPAKIFYVLHSTESVSESYWHQPNVKSYNLVAVFGIASPSKYGTVGEESTILRGVRS